MRCTDHPIVPGHEIVGVAEEVGMNINGIKVGDRLGVGTYVNSGRDCEFCEERLKIHCSKGAVFTFNGVDVDGSITKGGYFTFIVVHHRYCYRILENYPLESAAPLLCAGITVYRPMIHHKMSQLGKSLEVIGLGGLGHMAVKFGKAFGLNITVFSTSINKKEEAFSLLGADKFVVSSDKEEIKALAKSLDFIIGTASGNHLFDPYIEVLKMGGVLVLVGYPGELKLESFHLLRGMKTATSSASGGTKMTQ
ncbi:Alcohol dehydrogenase, N-terminal [Dillenia turbinata]|uniref:Alcohol dehydrogenase, N-terminal n=1 Tax=Dillenia turbinata TaxID=194707 RepID=A0AAN8UQJ3_9MAGN